VSDLTLNEQRQVRVALRLLRLRCDGWVPLAKVLHYEGDTLEKVTNGRRPVTASLAFRVARFVEVSVDDLLAGKYAPEGTCPHCGRSPDFSDEDTVAESGGGA
jgi:hypothetical protein